MLTQSLALFSQFLIVVTSTILTHSIIDFSIPKPDPRNRRKSNPRPVGKYAQTASTAEAYLQYYNQQLHRYELPQYQEPTEHNTILRDKSSIMQQRLDTIAEFTKTGPIYDVVFWFGEGSTGDYGPCLSIANDFAALEIPNTRVILYSSVHPSELTKTDTGVWVTGKWECLPRDPIFIVATQTLGSAHYQQFAKNALNQYMRKQRMGAGNSVANFDQERKKLILFESMFVSEMLDPKEMAAFIAFQKGISVKEIMLIYDSTPELIIEQHITDYGVISIRASNIALMHQQDLARTSDLLVPSVLISDSYISEASTLPDDDAWTKRYGDSKVILFALGGATPDDEEVTRRLGIAQYLLSNTDYCLIMHVHRCSDLSKDNLRKMSKAYPYFRFSTGLQPLAPVMKRCSLLIHHGGAGSVNMASRMGVTQLVLPTNCDEQVPNGLMIEDAGLGKIWTQPQLCDSDCMAAFLECVEELLTNTTYLKNAQEFAKKQVGTENNGRAVISDLLLRIFEKDVKTRIETQDGGKPEDLGPWFAFE